MRTRGSAAQPAAHSEWVSRVILEKGTEFPPLRQARERVAQLRRVIDKVSADVMPGVKIRVAPIQLQVVAVYRMVIAYTGHIIHGVAERIGDLSLQPPPGSVSQR